MLVNQLLSCDLSSNDRKLLDDLSQKHTLNKNQQRFLDDLVKKYLGDKNKKCILYNNRILLDFLMNRKESTFCNKIQGRIWEGKLQRWSIPLNNYSISIIREHGWFLDPKIEIQTCKKELIFNFPNNLKLLPFQIEGIKRLEELDGNALLADDMGLGKTVQAIGYLSLHLELRPCLLVVPSFLKINWQKEIYKWMPQEHTSVIYGNNAIIKPNSNIIIINYDIIGTYISILETMGIKYLICDESHMIKNQSAQRTRAVRYLGKQINKVLCISGTPITNRPSEFFTTLNLLDNKMFNNHERFLYEFCDKENDSSAKGSNNPQKLHEILIKSFMIRRRKKDVLTELPKKQRSVTILPIDNRDKYEHARNDLLDFLRQYEGNYAALKAQYAIALVRFEKLKQLASEGKMQYVFEWIDTNLQQDKLVIACVHKVVVNALMERYGNIAVKIDGSTSSIKKEISVERFQNDDNIRILVGNIKSAGVGLTLTRSHTMGIIELPWTPGECVQMEDRIHRIGQSEKVTIHYLVGDNTIELQIANLLDKKQKDLDAILDGAITEKETLLSYLIQEYMNAI
ncbi:MAG: DEAD/DEAH box helicase [Candidatus Thorarchaeota archaeon]